MPCIREYGSKVDGQDNYHGGDKPNNVGRQKNRKSVFLSGNPFPRIIEILNNNRSLSSKKEIEFFRESLRLGPQYGKSRIWVNRRIE